jgi:transposase
MKRVPRNYRPYPSDVSDEEWSFVAPYLVLNRLDGENRRHDLRAVFNALRWLVRSGASWRMMPHEFPPWPAVYQQMRRWLEAGCFEAMVNDLRALLRMHAGRGAQLCLGRTISCVWHMIVFEIGNLYSSASAPLSSRP